MMMNKILSKAAEKLYSAARWCEGRSIMMGLEGKVFERPNLDPKRAGVVGVINLPLEDQAVRSALVKGYQKSKKMAPKKIRAGAWKGKSWNKGNKGVEGIED